MGKKDKSKWNIKNMNEWCLTNATGYLVLEIIWIQKSYQNQLWVLIKCQNKNHKPYMVCWNKFYSHGRRCSKCDYERRNITEWNCDKVIEFYKNYSLEILDIKSWKSVDLSILCHDKYNFKVFASITNLKAGRKPSPIQCNIYALDNIKLYCKLFRPDYEIISDKYINVKTEGEWKYIGNYLKESVNRNFKTTVDGFINGGKLHPNLSKSDIEIKIQDWLIKNNINFKDEYRFKECKDKNTLPFDFYLLDYRICIEAQGIQHYKSIEYFGGEKTYIKQLKHDRIKNNYCKDNNIMLLEIPYWDFNNYESILKDFFRLIKEKDLEEVS